MKKSTFFVATTLEEVILPSEQEAGKKLSRKFAFDWLMGPSSSPVTENSVRHIVQRVFMQEPQLTFYIGTRSSETIN